MKSYTFQVEMFAAPELVWSALTEKTNQWWLDDFRVTGPDAVVKLDPVAGGQLMETSKTGSLLWYTVQMATPADWTLHLTGFLAPDFGGPLTSHLRLAVRATGDGHSVLEVSDALVGHTDPVSDSLEPGWRQLFTDGLKAFVEAGVPDGESNG